MWVTGFYCTFVIFTHEQKLDPRTSEARMLRSLPCPLFGGELGSGFDPGCSGASDKDSACQCRRNKRCGFDPWVGKIPWRRKWQPTLVFLPGEPHGRRSLAGYSPWSHKRVGHDLSNLAHRHPLYIGFLVEWK